MKCTLRGLAHDLQSSVSGSGSRSKAMNSLLVAAHRGWFWWAPGLTRISQVTDDKEGPESAFQKNIVDVRYRL